MNGLSTRAVYWAEQARAAASRTHQHVRRLTTVEATAAVAGARLMAGHGEVAIARAQDALDGLVELARPSGGSAFVWRRPTTVLAAWQVAGVLRDAGERELAHRAERAGRTLLDRYAAQDPAEWERVRAVVHRHDAIQKWRREELEAAAAAFSEAMAAWGRLARRRPWRIRSIRAARAENAADRARVIAAQGDLAGALHVAETTSLRGLRAGSRAHPRWRRAYAAILSDIADWYQATDKLSTARMNALYATRQYANLPTAKTEQVWLDDKRGLAHAVQTAAYCGDVMSERERPGWSTYYYDEQIEWAVTARRKVAAATNRSADRAALIDALLLAVRWSKRDEQDMLFDDLRNRRRSKRLGRMRELVELSERLAQDTTEQDHRAVAWWNHARIAAVLAATLAEDGSDEAAMFFDRAVAGGDQAIEALIDLDTAPGTVARWLAAAAAHDDDLHHRRTRLDRAASLASTAPTPENLYARILAQLAVVHMQLGDQEAAARTASAAADRFHQPVVHAPAVAAQPRVDPDAAELPRYLASVVDEGGTGEVGGYG